MKAYFCTALAIVLLVATTPALGGLVKGTSARTSPLQIKPKVDCEGWDILIALSELLNKIDGEVYAGIQSAKETVNGPEDFDRAFDNFRSFSEVELNGAVTIITELAEIYPWKCEDIGFGTYILGVHAKTSVTRAGNTLASLAFLKSPELHEVVKKDMAARVAEVVQDMEDVEALIQECQLYWCGKTA